MWEVSECILSAGDFIYGVHVLRRSARQLMRAFVLPRRARRHRAAVRIQLFRRVPGFARGSISLTESLFFFPPQRGEVLLHGKL